MSPGSDPPPSLNLIRVERRIHAAVNEARSEHGLSALDLDHELSAVARDHAADMADRSFVAHVCPDGCDVEDRYRAADYDCRVPVGGGRYRTGAENVAKTYYQAPLEGGDWHEDADDVAWGIVDGWLESPGHRENLLDPHWRCEGIGVGASSEGSRIAVYATQNFC